MDRYDGRSGVRSTSGAAILDRGAPVSVPAGGGVHDEIYRAAAGDLSRVPWAEGRPNPHLVAWLNAEAPGIVRPGARAVVVGCGLGDDVVELANRGFDAVGFDLSPTAVEWARHRFPEHARSLVVGDLFTPQSRWRHRFDLVVEVYTLQSIEPALREKAAAAIADLSCPRGTVVAVCQGRGDSERQDAQPGPPWPLTRGELESAMASAGLRPARPVDEFDDDETPPVRRLRGVFVHG